jgi:hypothetical protein
LGKADVQELVKLLPLHLPELVEGEIAEHKLHDDILAGNPMRSLVYLLELPVINFVDVLRAYSVDSFNHVDDLLDLFRVLGREDVAVLDDIDEEHLPAVLLAVVVGDIVFVVVKMQYPELLLRALVQPALHLVDVTGIQQSPQLLQDLGVLLLLPLLPDDVVGEQIVVSR